ncbi:MAG: ABC transporter substrate-binding protein [Pseudomonadota bacterium]
MKLAPSLAALAAALFLLPARADVTVGVTLSATGPGAALGGPEKNTLALAPATVGGEKVRYVVLDDGTDPTSSTKNVQKLVSEEKADVIIGSSTVPTTLAAARMAAEFKTPLVTMAPIKPAPEVGVWVFTTPQSVAVMANAVVRHMKAAGVKTLGYIGFNDPYGEDWWNNLSKAAEAAGIKVVASERYNRTDTSATGQVLKILAANPDAVFVGASGTPSVLPQAALVERGYKGKVYQSHGSASREFLRVGGKSVEGTVLPVGPVLVAEQLPDSHPSKAPALDYLKRYEAAHGVGSRNTFGAHAWDALLLVHKAIPEALKKAKPGTAEFRQAMRDALEGLKEVAATHGVFDLSRDHNGLDERAVVLVRVEGGDWKLLK